MNSFFPNPSVPNLLNAPGFDSALETFKSWLLEFIQNNDPENYENVSNAIQDDAGMFAKLVQGCCYVANLQIQQANVKAMQNFASFAKGDMLDAKVADLGLERQIIQDEDLNANPPKQLILESDESLLTRYYLASYTLKPGSTLGYEFHARTVGDRPLITVDSSIPGEINVKYKFQKNDNASKVRGAKCVQVSPGVLDIFILPHVGIADADLLNSVNQYIHREDIKEATDTISIKAASEVNYEIHIKVTNTLNQNPAFIKEQLEMELATFADTQRQQNSIVRPEQVGGVVYAKSLPDYEVIWPAVAVIGSDSSAPNCTGITVEVI
ncbi:baseplate J/gp47 family protein [Pseudoalteromonas sp.]|uniref:baseplate J/gp47 family protein n=1 Tax=Pseudoalteromonas sp. TaxID=53249 RepID=UPI00235280A7|nr:baseplate J/gp47 family protein [Pseudoalteromonas sp.]